MSKHVCGSSYKGDRYEGEWKRTEESYMPHGFGIMKRCLESYEGEWKDGKRHGKGIVTEFNGTSYEGEWKDGKRVSQNSYTCIDNALLTLVYGSDHSIPFSDYLDALKGLDYDSFHEKMYLLMNDYDGLQDEEMKQLFMNDVNAMNCPFENRFKKVRLTGGREGYMLRFWELKVKKINKEAIEKKKAFEDDEVKKEEEKKDDEVKKEEEKKKVEKNTFDSQIEACSNVRDDGTIEIDAYELLKMVKKEEDDSVISLKGFAHRSDWFCNEEDTKFPTHEELCDNVPAFNFCGKYPDIKDPTFYCGWEIPSLGYKWVIMAYDPKSKVAFGYARIYEGEYGIIDMDEIRESFEKFKNSFKALCSFRETFKRGSIKKSKMSAMFTF